MNALFRVDASAAIGTGHVMRCLALAAALKDRGAATSFLCKTLPDSLRDRIASQGHRLRGLHGGSATETGTFSHVEDAAQCEQLLAQSSAKTDWLIVDHYGIDAAWETRLRRWVGKILVIDDLANRSHDCDALLDQNLYDDMYSRYDGLTSVGAQRLLGPRFALLRREFRDARASLRRRDGTVRRILVLFGGADPHNETAKALHGLRGLGRPDIALDIVLGSDRPHDGEVGALSNSLPNATLHYSPESIAEIMARADFAIGAGGITHWERCCLGLPSIAVGVAGNQEKSMVCSERAGLVTYLGQSERVSPEAIAHAVQRLISDPGTLRSMTKACLEAVDALGAERVADTLAR